MHTKRSPLTITKAVLFALVLREMRGRFSAQRMGAFWFIFEPAAHVVVMMAERIYLRGKTLPGFDYPVFLVTGLIPYLMFKNIAIQGMHAVDANRALFAYRQIKPLDCIVARAILESALMSIVYIVMIFALGFWCGYDVSIDQPLQWLGTLLIGVIFSFSLGVIFCLLIEAVPSVKTFIALMFIPLYFLSGVLLPSWLLPLQAQRWMSFNPFFQFTELLRTAIFVNYPTAVGVNAPAMVFLSLSLLTVALGLYLARRQSLVSL